MLACPFCGAPETDRFEIEEKRFLVFGCMFSPEVDPSLDDVALASLLTREYGARGSAYFRAMCDRLHLVVAKPPEGGAEALPPT